MVERKQMHLQDLFKTGVEVRFELDFEDEPVEIVIWMRKPTAGQQDEAMNKARGIQARRKTVYRDKDSYEYLALVGDLEEFNTVGLLKEQIIKFEEQQLRSRAFNEVLHQKEFQPKDEDGKPKWGDDSTEYLDLLGAIQVRMEEISQFNSELEEGDESLKLTFDDDEELSGLQADRDEFENFVTERFEVLKADALKEFSGKKVVELRKILQKKLIETDTSLTWYEEYRKYMLYFSCRNPEDKTEPYFTAPEEVLIMPPNVISFLENQLEDLDSPGNALKNLPSLQDSSDS